MGCIDFDPNFCNSKKINEKKYQATNFLYIYGWQNISKVIKNSWYSRFKLTWNDSETKIPLVIFL